VRPLLLAFCLASSAVLAQQPDQLPTTRAGNSASRAVAIQGVTGGLAIPISGSISTSGTADVVSATATFNANSVCTSDLLLAGEQGAGFQLNSGTLAATLTPSYSNEASGTNFTNTQFIDQNGAKSATLVVTNPNSLFQQGIVVTTGTRRVRVCTTAFTSGSATGFTSGAFVQGGAAAGGGGGGTVTQGNAGTNAQAWWMRIGDATNGPAAVKAASTAAVAADLSQVVSLSPNNPIPTGSNVIGSLSANQSVNVTQFGGTNVVTGTGAGGAGVPRVTISNDSSLAANQSVNVAQIAGSTTSTAATGVQKLGVTGNTGAALDAAGQNVAAPANELLIGGTFNTTPTTIVSGNMSPLQMTSAARLIVDGSQVTQPVSGTVTANQGSPPWQVVGNVASGSADSNNPVKVGGIFNTTQPTVTTGQRVDAQATSRGELLIAKGVTGFSIDNTGFNVNNTPAVTQSGAPWHTDGNIASGTAESGNPMGNGGRAATAIPTAVSDGQRVEAQADKFGRFHVGRIDRGLLTKSGVITVSTTTETTLIAAGGTGVFLDLVYLHCENTSTTATRVDIRDATAGTIRDVIECPAAAGTCGGYVNSLAPFTQTTANSAWTIQLATAVTDVRCVAMAEQTK